MRNESRYLLVIYAIAAWCLGFVAFSWPNLWLHAGEYDLGDIYFGRAALWRIFAAIIIASGCFAAAFVRVDDPRIQRDGLLWLAGALGIVSMALTTQVLGPWGPGIGQRAAWITAIAAICLACEAAIRSWPPPAKSLRSQYEQHIRQAAGQEERNRLARDLHDSIKQQIFAIHTAAATAQARFDSDPVGTKEALDQVRGSAREAMTEMEVMLDQLGTVPLENAGLVEALKKQCEALGFRTGAKVDFQLGVLPFSNALPPGAHQAIFRVAQEALANVARHARAKKVTVSLDSYAGLVELKVQDDGVGFDLDRSRRGMGTANMQARTEEFGGKFDQVSTLGSGTTVRLSIPCIGRPPQPYFPMIWGATLALSLVLMWRDTRGGMWMVYVPMAAAGAVNVYGYLFGYLRARNRRETTA
jgi:signal transduction histidine kinase